MSRIPFLGARVCKVHYWAPPFYQERCPWCVRLETAKKG